MQVDEHTAYIKARSLSKHIWEICTRWDRIAQNTVGSQLIRSADSISANLAEGWNRYSKKDKINFYVIARGSANESIDWISKARERNLINEEEYKLLVGLLIDLPKEINGLIKGTRQYLKK